MEATPKPMGDVLEAVIERQAERRADNNLPPLEEAETSTRSLEEAEKARDAYVLALAAESTENFLYLVPPLPRPALLHTNCEAYKDKEGKSEALEIATAFATRGAYESGGRDRFSLFLTGQYGTGKTWLGTAAWKRLLYYNRLELINKATRPVDTNNPNDSPWIDRYGTNGPLTRRPALVPIWRKFYSFIREVQDCYHPKSEHPVSVVLERYQQTPVLMLDDVGDLDQHVESEDRRRLLYEVLDYRNDHGLPTVMTTNLNLSELEQQFGGRTVQRVIEMAVMVEMSGSNLRIEPVSDTLTVTEGGE